MLYSHSLRYNDFKSVWYKKWAKELLQDSEHLENFSLYSNKFWQNAAIVQALWERGVLSSGNHGLGFGVGKERLPALFAKMGAKITATDQDYSEHKARHWEKHELSKNAEQLNGLGICNPDIFGNNVEFLSANMKNISKKLYGKYNFVWSNCALGHIGSIEAGLKFIQQSLECLVPGGWAVHTTELNILSNEETVMGGDTVIFRLKDIYDLQQKLVSLGYKVSPFVLTLGNTKRDKRISLAPQFGNDYSKIQYKGQLATQILLIIQKPKHFKHRTANSDKGRVMLWKPLLNLQYKKNLILLRRYKNSDPTLNLLLANKQAEVEEVKIRPVKVRMNVKMMSNSDKTIRLVYRNNSAVPLVGANTVITAKPIALATTNPQDRSSKFTNLSWASYNRPSTKLWVGTNPGDLEELDYANPQEYFAFDLILNSGKLKKGFYEEDFSIVQEMSGWVPNSTVHIVIEVA